MKRLSILAIVAAVLGISVAHGNVSVLNSSKIPMLVGTVSNEAFFDGLSMEITTKERRGVSSITSIEFRKNAWLESLYSKFGEEAMDRFGLEREGEKTFENLFPNYPIIVILPEQINKMGNSPKKRDKVNIEYVVLTGNDAKVVINRKRRGLGFRLTCEGDCFVRTTSEMERIVVENQIELLTRTEMEILLKRLED